MAKTPKNREVKLVDAYNRLQDAFTEEMNNISIIMNQLEMLVKQNYTKTKHQDLTKLKEKVKEQFILKKYEYTIIEKKKSLIKKTRALEKESRDFHHKLIKLEEQETNNAKKKKLQATLYDFEQFIKQDLALMKKFAKEIKQWDEKVERARKRLKKLEPKDANEVEFFLDEIFKEEFTELKHIEQNHNKISNSATNILGLLNLTIKQTGITLKYRALPDRTIIIDANFLGAIHHAAEGRRAIIDNCDIRNKHIIIPSAVIREARSGNNKHNSVLITAPSFDNLKTALNEANNDVHIENWDEDCEQQLKDRIHNIWQQLPAEKRTKGWDHFVKSADFQIILHVHTHHAQRFILLSDDGDFNVFNKAGLLGNTKIIKSKNHVFKTV